MNAVIYCRYSSHNQQEQSIEGQLRICHDYAKRESIEVIGEYIDRAISGRTDQRPQFQQMIKDARKRQFDYVIVYKLDRFARNRYDSASYKHKLKKDNVRVLSATENIDDSPESVMLEAVLEGQAEYFSLALSKRITDGLQQSIINGTFTGGTPTLGYKVVNKKIEIDEEAAQAVRYIFKAYASGTPKKQIIEHLRNKGIKSNRGSFINQSSLTHILNNKKYIGINVYRGNEYTGAYPPIITKELFGKAQIRLDKNKRAPGAAKAQERYLLLMKAFCGKCGAKLIGESGRSRNGEKHCYYTCSTRKKEHSCNKKNEKKDFLEWYVVEQTLDYVLLPERMEFIADKIVEEYDKEFNASGVKELEILLSKTEREADKAFEKMFAAEDPAIEKRFEAKLKELEAKKADIEIDLAQLRIAAQVRLTKKEVIKWMSSFCGGDLFDPDFRERVIDAFVNAVYVYDDKIIIYYNLKDSEQVSYIDSSAAVAGLDKENLNSRGVRILNNHLHHVGAKFALLRFSFLKNSRLLPCFSFSQKGIAFLGNLIDTSTEDTFLFIDPFSLQC